MAFTDVLRKSFPFISAAASLGGPIGTMAATLVGKAIGADKAPTPTVDGISTAIATALADPQQRGALIQAEQDFQKQMTELGYQHAEELEQTAASDRANARQREMTLKDRIPALLAIMVTVGFFGVLSYMLFRPVPPAGHDALLLMLGGLGSAWTAVVAYYFGSSAGSDRKTELLAQAPPITK
jgi:cation transport ATPase